MSRAYDVISQHANTARFYATRYSLSKAGLSMERILHEILFEAYT